MKALTLINADSMAVAILPEITVQRDLIVTVAKTITTVTSQWDDGEAVEVLCEIKGMLKAVEDSRDSRRADYLPRYVHLVGN